MQSLCAKSRCRDKVASLLHVHSRIRRRFFFFFFFFFNERLTLFIVTFMSKCTAHLPDEKPTRKLLQDMEMVTKMRLVLFVCLFVCLLLFSINCKAQRSSCSLKPLHLNPVLK